MLLILTLWPSAPNWGSLTLAPKLYTKSTLCRLLSRRSCKDLPTIFGKYKCKYKIQVQMQIQTLPAFIYEKGKLQRSPHYLWPQNFGDENQFWYQNFPIPVPRLFSDTNLFRYRFRYHQKKRYHQKFPVPVSHTLPYRSTGRWDCIMSIVYIRLNEEMEGTLMSWWYPQQHQQKGHVVSRSRQLWMPYTPRSFYMGTLKINVARAPFLNEGFSL